MDFSSNKPRRASEPALPMINVVFLLLIFFLMAAQIVPPAPADVALPLAKVTPPLDAESRLYITADGTLWMDNAEGDEVWQLLSPALPDTKTALLIHADARLEASKLAQIISRLSEMGYAQIGLATTPE